jgi:hypothetical protein
LQLSVAIGRNVSVWYTRPEMQFPEQRYKKDVGSLCGEGVLSTEFEIPEGASRLKLFVDLKRRNVSASMTLASPGDRNTAKSAVGWVLGQLSKCQDDTILIRATWPRRQPSTSATVGALRKDRSVLLNGGDQVPTQFELVRIVDLAGKFRGSRTFVDAVETVLQSFYTDIGQNLRSWVPAAPRVKLPNAGEILEGSEPTEGYPVTTARQELVPVDQAKAAETPDTEPLSGPIVGADLQIQKTTQQPSDPQPVLPDTTAK